MHTCRSRMSDALQGAFVDIPEISLCDISGISTKAPCEAALIHEHHMRIEISDFVMRTFGLYPKKVLHQLVTPPKSLDTLKMVNRQRICFFVCKKSSHTLV